MATTRTQAQIQSSLNTAKQTTGICPYHNVTITSSNWNSILNATFYYSYVNTVGSNRNYDWYVRLNCKKCGIQLLNSYVRAEPDTPSHTNGAWNINLTISGNTLYLSWKITGVNRTGTWRYNLPISGISHNNISQQVDQSLVNRYTTELNEAIARDNAELAFDRLNLTGVYTSDVDRQARVQLDIIHANGGSNYAGYTSRLVKYTNYVSLDNLRNDIDILRTNIAELHNKYINAYIRGKANYDNIFFKVN